MSIHLLSISLVSLGAGFMLASIVASIRVKGIYDLQGAKWRGITFLMVFFLIGYLAYLTVQLYDITFPLEFITSSIFFGGSLFVFLVINLTRTTIGRIKESENQIVAVNESLRQKNAVLEQEIACRRQAEDKLQTITAAANDAIIMINGQGRITFWNRAAARIFGYQAEEALGNELHGLLAPPRFHQAYAENFPEFVRTGSGPTIGKTVELCSRRKDGSEFPIEVSLASVKIDNQWYAVGVVKDIAARKKAEEALRLAHDQLEQRVAERTAELAAANAALSREVGERQQAEEQIRVSHSELDQIFNTAADGMRIIDKDHNVLLVNDTFLRLFASSRKKAVGKKCHEFMPNRYCNTAACPVTRILAGEARLEMEVEMCGAAGKGGVPCVLTAMPFRDADGEVIGIIEDFKDITERKKLEERLRELSLTDELTGLLNRRGFMTLAEKQLKVADRNGGEIFLLYADVDNLKWINDSLGHKIGDQALVEAAAVLKETFRETDIVGRLGGDEFTVLSVLGIDTSRTGQQTHPVLKRLQENIRAKNGQAGREYVLSISIGLVGYNPGSPCTLEELLSKADMLMYESKKGNKKGKESRP